MSYAYEIDLKIPPYSLEAEMSVLGCMIIERPAITCALAALEPESFYDQRHRLLFIVIRDMGDEPVDLVTLTAELKRLEKFEYVGRAEYLTSLMDMVPTALHIDSYVRIVKTKAVLRALINAATELVGECYQEDDLEVLVRKSEEMGYRIASMMGGREIQAATRSPQDFAAEYLQNLDLRREHREPELKTGFPKIDNTLWGLHRGELITIGARPAVGKSAVCINIAYNLIRSGKKALYFSTEMSVDEQWNRIIPIATSLEAFKFRQANFSEQEVKAVSKAAEWLHDGKNFYVCEIASPTIEQIRMETKRYKPDVVIIDYLQRCTYPQADREDLRIGDFMKQLKTLGRTENACIIVTSQLNRNVENRTSKIPNLADLRESGNIEQESDCVILLHQDSPETQVEGNVTTLVANFAKNRHGHCGAVKLCFLKDRQKITELDI